LVIYARISLRGAAFLAALAIAASSLCASCTWQSPRTVAQDYMSALEDHHYDQCYAMLTEADRQVCSLDRFLTLVPLAPDVTRRWFHATLKATSFKIGEPAGQGLRRIIPIDVKAPDLVRFERIIDATVGPDADPAPVADKALAHGDYPQLAYLDDIVLVKEHHRWRVRADFPARQQAADLRRQALDLYYGGSYKEAIDYYRQAIELLEKSDATGGWGLKFRYGRELHEIEEIAGQSAAAAAYLDNLKLSEIEMRMSAQEHPAVFGKITNHGNRPLDEVRMKVTFFKGHGAARRALFIEQHIPIATPLQFTDFTIRALPLMPGETRDFGFELKAPISTQQVADPYVAVSDVVFTESALMPPADSHPTGKASPAATAAEPED
jgi:tetratricopeptide (TPR) repeat protein